MGNASWRADGETPLGFRVQGSGFQGLGFEGLSFRVLGLGFRETMVPSSELRLYPLAGV